MLASEKMAKRALLHGRLVMIDVELKKVFGQPPSNRVTAIARELLNNRAKVCDELSRVGYLPWDIPADVDGERVASG